MMWIVIPMEIVHPCLETTFFFIQNDKSASQCSPQILLALQHLHSLVDSNQIYTQGNVKSVKMLLLVH